MPPATRSVFRRPVFLNGFLGALCRLFFAFVARADAPFFDIGLVIVVQEPFWGNGGPLIGQQLFPVSGPTARARPSRVVRGTRAPGNLPDLPPPETNLPRTRKRAADPLLRLFPGPLIVRCGVVSVVAESKEVAGQATRLVIEPAACGPVIGRPEWVENSFRC